MVLSSRETKRVLDVAVAMTGLVLLAPALPLIALAIRLEGPGDLFHRDVRVGIDRRSRAVRGGSRVHDARGWLFTRYRFRVLGDRVHTHGRLPGEHPRLTRVGRWLRRTGLEGWPQLVNVLRGQMSLVGPRPATPECVDRLARECPAWPARAGHVRPGLVGFAQLDHPHVSGFLAAVCEKLVFDLEYERRLDRAGVVKTVTSDLALLWDALRRRWGGTGRAVGNDVIRIDYPASFRQLALHPSSLARRPPAGLGAEVVEADEGLTAYWYPPRHPGGLRPAVDAEVLAALCDQVRDEDDALVLTRALTPSGVTDADVVTLEVPATLRDVHPLCDHFMALWEGLASRSRDPHLPLAMTFVMVEALVAGALALDGEPGRLKLRIEIGDRDVRLSVSTSTRSGAVAPWPRVLASSLAPA